MFEKRDRNYRREQREKHIKKRKDIVKNVYFLPILKCDGKYNKNKVHCSCGMCMAKTNNKTKRHIKGGNYAPNRNWKPSDKRKLDKMDYEDDEAIFYLSNLPNDQDIDWFDAIIEDVFVDDEPLDGKWFDRLIDAIDF